jgi:anti-sigma B factor antagonist
VNFRVDTAPLDEGAYLVDLAGEVDLHTAPQLKEALHAVIDDGARFVVVDLTDTTFIDSTTLGVLLGGLKRLTPEDGSVVLVCGNPNIRKIFEITLLDRVFTIVDTRDEAVAAVAA